MFVVCCTILATHRRGPDDEADVALGDLVLRPRQHRLVQVLPEPDDGGAQEAAARRAPRKVALRDPGTGHSGLGFTFALLN